MQFIVIKEQLLSMLWSLFLGVFFAFSFDAVRILRMLICGFGIKPHKIYEKIPTVSFGFGRAGRHFQLFVANVFDVLYSVFAAASFCIFLFQVNNGRFRWYLLLGCVLGFVLYRLSVGRLTVLVYGFVADTVRVAVGFALFILSRPFVWAAGGAAALAKPVAAALRRRLKIRETEKIKRALSGVTALDWRSP